jgi:hypothetical protein
LLALHNIGLSMANDSVDFDFLNHSLSELTTLF